MGRLIVIAPGLSDPESAWQSLLDRLKNESQLAGAAWFFWKHKCKVLSLGRVESLARSLSAEIEERCLANGHEDVVLVGFSAGAVIARQAFLFATGTFPVGQYTAPQEFRTHVSVPIAEPESERPVATYESIKHHFAHDPHIFRSSAQRLDEPRPAFADSPDAKSWAKKVSRFVLVASLSRGVEPSRISVFLGAVVHGLNGFALPHVFLMQDLLEGSPAITNLRLEWVRYFRNQRAPKPVVVQLLGTQDTLVSREDCIDTEQFPNAWHLDVPRSTHLNIHHVDHSPESDERYALFRQALIDTPPARIHAIVPAPIKKTAVIFLLHGIRDANSEGWVGRMTLILPPVAQNLGRQIIVVPSTYGYLSAIRFALPWSRRKNIFWFMNQYSQAFSQYPDADFYFVGHSNGTYLLGQCLAQILAMRFERVYLAGSVLPRQYDWMTRFYTGQVKEVRNDRCRSDWPVAFLCNGLRGLLARDIGTGGFDGFDNGVPCVQELYYYIGGHGGALVPGNLNNVAQYVLTGTIIPTLPHLAGNAPSTWFSMFSRMMLYLSPLLMLALLALCWLVAVWVVGLVGLWSALPILVLIFYMLWTVLDTF